uniref:Sulfotransferase 1C4-like n=1 Tax=Crassostrea virginica TaxID=6565 RepID=A0A8B8AA21_CRAVI|nr:sulfotransferase 1C4-like [Crassostrea virginica]
MAANYKERVVYNGLILPSFKPLLENPEARINAIKDLEGRCDDVIITAFPRSGTHWTWEIVNMLLTQNDEYTDKTKETAFLEFVDDLNKVEHIPSPRILNTHVPYGWLPNQHIEKKRKIIHVVRNPKDVFVSYFHFKKNFGLSEDWNEFFKSVIVGPNAPYGGWIEYEKAFDPDRENVFVISYENLKLKPTEEILKLAKFLGVDCSDELIEKIADKCGFDKLKNAHWTLKKTESKVEHYRKGEVGDWKNHFTVAQNAEFEELLQSKVDGSSIYKKFYS